jgi:Ca2+-binding RTX toxin-like protein
MANAVTATTTGFTATTSTVNNSDAVGDVVISATGGGTTGVVNLASATGSQGFTITHASGTATSLVGSAQADAITALGGANDTLIGGAGADALNGGTGADSISAGSGADLIDGGTGNDSIVLSTGQETVSVTAGDSTAYSAEGITEANVAAGETLTFGNGVDVVTGFTAGLGGDVMNTAIATAVTLIGSDQTANTSAVGYFASGNFVAASGVFTLTADGVGADTLLVAGLAGANLNAAADVQILIGVDSDNLVGGNIS